MQNPAIVAVIILAVILICFVIYFYRQVNTLQDKVVNLENVLSTTIKEVGDSRENNKKIPWLVKAVNDQNNVINSLTEHNATLTKELKRMKKNMDIMSEALTSNGIVELSLVKDKKKKHSRKRKSKRESVRFESDSDESSESDSDDYDSDDSEDEVSDIKRRLEKMKNKKKKKR